MSGSDYRPAPVDVGGVQLDGGLLEAMARGIHDRWAAERMREGWVYGPARDDRLKTHPGLVPFEQLSESEKDYDRATARQALAQLLALGYSLRGGGAVEEISSGSDAAFESPAAHTTAAVEPAFEMADSSAVRLGRLYRALALVSAVLGTLAVLLAIVQLFIGHDHPRLLGALLAAEFASVALCLAGVISGMWWRVHHRWLVERHKAERLRALAAERLIRHFAAPMDEAEFRGRIEELAGMNFEALRRWLKRDLTPMPPELMSAGASPSALEAFRRVYVQSRLAPQSTYLTEAEHRHERRDRLTRRVPVLLFFASILCVGVHSALHPLHGHLAEELARLGLLLAACLPVVSAGLRSYREAVQMSRNAARFASKATALEILRTELLTAALPRRALVAAWHAEQVLEAEHREWLRLMIEAEWFG